MSRITTDQQEWLQARLELLQAEKAHARATAALAAQRREMPQLRIERDYRFRGEAGDLGLADLFDGCSQLIVQHVMFGPDADVGCPMCSFWLDGVDPMCVHLRARDVKFVAVSRAPLERLLAYRERMGWGFDWVSSGVSEFNVDFHVSATQAELAAGSVYYNYADGPARMSDMHGTSVFLRDEDGAVYHTYSTYARGLDAMNAAYAYIDLTPKGRDEAELPFSMAWVRRHDEYT